MAGAYFLSFFIASTAIGDWHLVVDLAAFDGQSKDFCMLLPAESFQLIGINQRSAVQQIAAVNVRESGVVQDVEQTR